MASGLVYILTNPAFQPDYLKIGMTTRTVEERAWEIFTGATGVPLPFEIVAIFPMGDCHMGEKQVHEQLARYRVSPNREFFKVDLVIATEVAASVGEQVNRLFPIEASNPIRKISRVKVISDFEATDEHIEHGDSMEYRPGKNSKTIEVSIIKSGSSFRLDNQRELKKSLDGVPVLQVSEPQPRSSRRLSIEDIQGFFCWWFVFGWPAMVFFGPEDSSGIGEAVLKWTIGFAIFYWGLYFWGKSE